MVLTLPVRVTSANTPLVRVFSEREDQDKLKVIDFLPSQDDNIKVLLGMDVLGRFSEVRIRGFELDFGEVLKAS